VAVCEGLFVTDCIAITATIITIITITCGLIKKDCDVDRVRTTFQNRIMVPINRLSVQRKF
jgi:hypothetical protein